MRVIITGSRDWPEQRDEVLYRDLEILLRDSHVQVLTVVHGAHWSGIDTYAASWCKQWVPMALFLGKEVVSEPHPAKWNVLGRSAGPIRNQEMVDLGADLCIGYPIDLESRSSGTRDCMLKASQKLIPVWDRAGVI